MCVQLEREGAYRAQNMRTCLDLFSIYTGRFNRQDKHDILQVLLR